MTAMQAASYETAFRLLYLIGSQHAGDDDAAADVGKRWALAEFDLTNDPSGRGGEDLLN